MGVRYQDNIKAPNSIEKLQEKDIRLIKFIPSNASVLKEMNELKILKIKDFITLNNILLLNDCLEKERIKSFDSTLKIEFFDTRSEDAYQLKKQDFKNKKEKHERFSILHKILPGWNHTQHVLKTNFKESNDQKLKHLSRTNFSITTS